MAEIEGWATYRTSHRDAAALCRALFSRTRLHTLVMTTTPATSGPRDPSSSGSLRSH